ncbi:transporter substrate-binding domain-containing protein [Paraglaciecola chathamensis]|uniref:substrate-binding periplasmic protein n=1 Tax=Paraglaciecola chathamensis TaxID=368405 RepID=UPI0026FB290D|nr:transporter substrate-binding domain-containing protein [Paraglaciecola chathamensis]MDO6840740.1 transporter substrate-binding domain-containing protein [Paraglaciecola chathamensis]
MTLARWCKLAMLLALLPLSLRSVQAVEPHTLTFAVNTPGSFPYLYFDNNTKSYQGVVRDFLDTLQNRELFDVRFVDSNQQRSERFVTEGKVDLYLANPGWVSEPEKVTATLPIIMHNTFLYSTAPFEERFNINTLVNRKMCTQQDYVYTGLQALFDHRQLVRVESARQDTLGLMLVKGRCDYSVLNDYNAKLVFSAPEYCAESIYESPKPTSTIALTIVMRAALQPVKKLMDEQLTAFIGNGEIQRSLQRHSNQPVFPKLPNCH